MLAQTERYRAAIFERDEAIHYADARNVLGEAVDGCAETFRSCLRNFSESQEAIAQCTCPSIQYSG